MFRPEKGPEITTKKEIPQNKQESLNEETKREIDQHLKYIWEKTANKLAYQSGRAVSIDEMRKIEQELKSKEVLIKKAKEQLEKGEPGKEILDIILDFPTSEEEDAKEKLYVFHKLLKRQKPDEFTKKQERSFEEQIGVGRKKRESWAKQLKENWEKR